MYKFMALASLVMASSYANAKSDVIKISPVDLGVINKAQITYWLKKRGVIGKHSTQNEIDIAVNGYIKGVDNRLAEKLKKDVLYKEAQIQRQLANRKKLIQRELKAQGHVAQANKVKVLGILVDFPDLPHNNNRLSADDTAMYYPEYPVSHYQSLMFSDQGFVGPNQQTIESAFQYYMHESGQSFELTGQVYDWVTADNNAAHYGGQETVDGVERKDKNVPALILEAVTKAVQEHEIDLAEYDFMNPYGVVPGTVEQPDGIVDHIMVFHSSVGEEAGGGVIGGDAIWSHQFYATDEQYQPLAVPNTQHRIYKYTICPIDAATGVVVHEFGHDLGLPDEYDTGGDDVGEPVAAWSVMSAGSWAGSPAGTRPVSFSPWARDFLQTKFGGNWINQREFELDQLNDKTTVVDLVDAVSHNQSVNQVKINLPPVQKPFYSPYEGEYQYFTGAKNATQFIYSTQIALPDSPDLKLSMKAHWGIENYYDYALVSVNGTSIETNRSLASNPEHPNVAHTITGNSKDIAGAEGTPGWVDIEADLSTYKGQTVTLEVVYITDAYELGYGLAFDDVKVKNSDDIVWRDNAEVPNSAELVNIKRILSTQDGPSHNYYIQLRSDQGTDAGLSGEGYSPGVLVWYRNDGFTDNKVGEHPGEGFIGVVDADQNSIVRNEKPVSSYIQVRDAAFSLYEQRSGLGDQNLTPISLFSDSLDYSAPNNPQAGLKLPKLGLSMEVIDEATLRTSASIALTRTAVSNFSATVSGLTVTFIPENVTVEEGDTIRWEFGDGNTSTSSQPVHTYQAAGNYQVRLTVSKQASDDLIIENTVSVAPALNNLALVISPGEGTIEVDASFDGGVAPFSYVWDFGDGVSSNALSTSHTYTKSGDYTVSLTVTDANGSVLSANQTVTTRVPMDITLGKTTSNLVVSFRSVVLGGSGTYSYAWNFGDGNVSTLQSPQHSYANEGDYSVTLTVTDSVGTEQVETIEVSVVAPNKTTTKSTSGSSGGSSGVVLLLLALVGLRRKRIV